MTLPAYVRRYEQPDDLANVRLGDVFCYRGLIYTALDAPTVSPQQLHGHRPCRRSQRPGE